MSSKVWLLVEWVDKSKSNVLPCYGVVNVDTMAYDETDIRPGNEIFIRVKHENPQRAKILRISENKQYVKEHKEILERQDQQVNNVLQICMRTIKEMKSDHSSLQSIQYDAQQASNRGALPHVVVASNADSGSDSESENSLTAHIQNFKKSASKIPPPYSRKLKPLQVRNSMNNSQHRRRSMISSTPLPSSSMQQKVTLCFDQATQTEGSFLQPPASKIEEMEAVLTNLYTRFQSLIAQVNINSGSTSMSESEHNDSTYTEINNGEYNNVEYEEQRHVEVVPEYIQDIGAEQVIGENGGDHPMNSPNVKVENGTNPGVQKVRRMSAQTTNHIEPLPSNDADLVPISSGHAKVPARLLKDIDWNTYTMATRQLLQAVFPRRVLATHSLTGKQSPAFMNRPPKKILDPKLVEDIVKIVSTKCGVPKSLVRNSITIKCTDEAKLYKNRQQYKMQRKTHNNENDENRPPSVPSSDESANAAIN